MAWQLPFEDMNAFQARGRGRHPIPRLHPALWSAPPPVSCRPAEHLCRPPSWKLAAWARALWPPASPPVPPLQIIVLVRERGTDSLPPLPRDQLPGGPLSCYDEYVALMRHCRNADPEGRPSFDEIVARLRCGGAACMLGRRPGGMGGVGMGGGGAGAMRQCASLAGFLRARPRCRSRAVA